MSAHSGLSMDLPLMRCLGPEKVPGFSCVRAEHPNMLTTADIKFPGGLAFMPTTSLGLCRVTRCRSSHSRQVACCGTS